MDKTDALKKAAHLCSRQEKCKFDIRTKLRQWDVSEYEHDEILEILEKEKFIDEKRFAGAFVNEKFKLNHWGRIKIRHFLQQKFIPNEYIEEALLQIDESNYEEKARQLIVSKNKTLKAKDDFDRKVKLIRSVSGKGYEIELLQNLVEQAIRSSK